MLNQNRLIKTSRFVVRTAFVVNRIFLAALVLGLLASFIFSTHLAALLFPAAALADLPTLVTAMRLEILIGLVGAAATDRLLAALAQIIASTGEGDPFISANARRLQTIGWYLLALQLLDIPAALLGKFFPTLGSAAPDGTFSCGGWIAVLMVFVLSRIFAAGSAMRDDLEGTV